MKLAHIADRVAMDIYTRPISTIYSTPHVVRDACVTATGGDLSTSMLDRLVDMVERRLRDSMKPGGVFWKIQDREAAHAAALTLHLRNAALKSAARCPAPIR
jgi:hypothetical protein